MKTNMIRITTVIIITLSLTAHQTVIAEKTYRIGIVHETDTWDLDLNQMVRNINANYNRSVLDDNVVRLNFTVEQVDQQDYHKIVKKVCSVLEGNPAGLISYVGCPLATIFDWLSRKHAIPNAMFIKEPCLLDRDDTTTMKMFPSCQQRNGVFRDILKWKNWEKAVILYDQTFSSRCLQDLIMKFSSMFAPSQFIDVSVINNRTQTAMLNIGPRPMFVITSEDTLWNLLLLAKDLHMFGSEHFWIISTDTNKIPDLSLLNINEGHIVVVRPVQPNYYRSDGACGDILSDGDNTRELQSYLVDAGALYVYGIRSSLSEFASFDVKPTNCSTDRTYQMNHGSQLIKNMHEVLVEGSSGLLHFGKDGYPKDPIYQICSLDRSSNGSLVDMGEWDTHDGLQLNQDQIFRNTFKDFGNKTLLIATQLANPFNIKIVENGTVRFTGYSFDILNELATRFQFNYKLIEPPDGMWGGPNDDGTWNGMVGMVMRGEVDFAVGPFTITSVRESVIDFGKPIMEDGVGIITKRPDGESEKVYKLFKPFAPPVWGCIGGSIIVVGFMLYFVTRFSPYSNNNREDGHLTTEQLGLSGSLWLIYGSYMEQGVEPHPSSVSGRCILGFWWLFTILMTSTYTANLAAFLTVSIAKKPINSLTELASQNQISPLIKVGTNLETLFKNAKSGVYRDIWEKMEDMPKVKQTALALDIVKTGTHAYMTDRSQLEYIVLNDCTTYALADEIFNTAGLGFVFPENAPYLDDFNYSIMRMQEAGLMEKWRQKWWSSTEQCVSSDRTSSAQVLGLDSLAGPFLVYLSVAGLSFICLLFEICIKNSPCSKVKSPTRNGSLKGIENGIAAATNFDFKSQRI